MNPGAALVPPKQLEAVLEPDLSASLRSIILQQDSLKEKLGEATEYYLVFTYREQQGLAKSFYAPR